MKIPMTMRLSDEAIAALEYIAKHYGIDKTAAATLAFVEWANILRRREAAQEPKNHATAGDTLAKE